MTFKEKDIRDPDILKKYFELVAKDSEKILVQKDSFEMIDQTNWGLGKSVPEFEKSGYVYEICLDTGTLFVNPRPRFDVLMDFYESSESSTYWVHEFFSPRLMPARKRYSDQELNM